MKKSSSGIWKMRVSLSNHIKGEPTWVICTWKPRLQWMSSSSDSTWEIYIRWHLCPEWIYRAFKSSRQLVPVKQNRDWNVNSLSFRDGGHKKLICFFSNFFFFFYPALFLQLSWNLLISATCPSPSIIKNQNQTQPSFSVFLQKNPILIFIFHR